ncbi:MAG TPA: hypothetical protein VMR16_02360 [Candidatus Saccharimonadales bacterium]|nr:hypothetical protein [Candidatus Saccharimonadales bacterium]
MANLLQKALKIDEPLFSTGMKILEKSTGNSGVDSRLIANIHENAHKVMRILGLDTGDTTGRELYHALVAAVKRGDIEGLLFDTDYVLYILDEKVISFNLIDVIENSHHELAYEKQVISHGQRSLRGEIIERYVKHARTDEATTLETIKSIGLLPDSDAWYNNAKAYK